MEQLPLLVATVIVTIVGSVIGQTEDKTQEDYVVMMMARTESETPGIWDLAGGSLIEEMRESKSGSHKGDMSHHEEVEKSSGKLKESWTVQTGWQDMGCDFKSSLQLIEWQEVLWKGCSGAGVLAHLTSQR